MATAHRLWNHTVRAPKAAASTIIAKLRGGVSPGGPSLPSTMGVTRGARAAGRGAPSPLDRLVDDGYVSRIASVFEDDAAPTPGLRGARLLGGAAARGTAARPDRQSAGIVEIRVSRGTNAKRLAAHVAGMHDVEYAFIPPVRTLFARRRRTAGPDPLASRQWGHGAIRLNHARVAAGFDDATAITVAVVDSGIDDGHPDLADAIVEYRNFLREGDKDYAGHGTHVAGIIGARSGNGLGISGVSGARILALKALPRNDGEFDATAYYRALRYVIGRANVLNLSLGGEKDPAELDVLRDVIDAGVVVVAAMGNEYEEGNPTEYPAAMPEVCAVGATDELDRRASFSNTGRHIDLVAPGAGILSTTPTYAYDDGERNYDAWDGTSMATPYVAGVAALILAKYPQSTPAQVIRRLKRSADIVAGAKRGSSAYGAGRLNCEKALA